MLTLGLAPARLAAVAPKAESKTAMRISSFRMGLSDYGLNGTDDGADESTASSTVFVGIELERLFPRCRTEIVFDHHQEFVGIGGVCRVVEPEGL